jgi:HlyD family secretion protein
MRGTGDHKKRDDFRWVRTQINRMGRRFGKFGSNEYAIIRTLWSLKIPAVVGIMMASLLFSCESEKAYLVQRKDLVQAVYASGEVLPVDFYEVTSKIPGIVDSIYVSVGQRVKAGDALLKIKSQSNELNLQTAKNLYELAKKNASKNSDLLIGLEQQMDAAYRTYLQDSLDYERAKRLNAQNIGSEQEYEQRKLRFESSRSNFIISKSNLKENRERLQVELKNAENNYRAQKSTLTDYMIVAAISGRVYDILPNPGELISSNHPVLNLGAADSFEVEILVDETDIILVKEGQRVIYELDALEDAALEGRVVKIFPRVSPVDKTAKVVATIEVSDYTLYAGMSLEANIIVQEKKDILVVPVEYLTMDDTAILKKGSKRETVKVETGIRDLRYVEVLSGLAENDPIIKP